MATKLVSIKIDEKLKEESSQLFSNLGLNFNSAITIYLKQAVREQGLPFKPTLPIVLDEHFEYQEELISGNPILIRENKK